MPLITAALTCLALNIYHEAKDQKPEGQMAIALVVHNRVHDEQKTVCGVVFAKRQFSWTNGNASLNKYGNVKLNKDYMPEKNDKEWLMAKRIAKLSYKVADFTHGATYFHSKKVHPYWSKDFKRTLVLGDHVFYRKVNT